MDSAQDWQSDPAHAVPHHWADTMDLSNQEPSIQEPATLEPDLTTPAALSSWSGSHFNKPSVVLSTGSMLMSQEEIDQTRNFELYRLHSVSFELNQGDTLVFIDYPVHHKEVLKHTDCHGIIYKSQQIRLHSSKLLETGSSKFAEMLSPTYQFRIQRRRKMVNKLVDGIKYLLDLTPPSEGDELVFQMTELSLTPGIIKWWSSSLTNDVDPWLVCGHDDICVCSRQPEADTNDQEQRDSTESETKSTENAKRSHNRKPPLPLEPETALQMKARGESSTYETPSYRFIPDYCPIRHRNGIVRLLMLIEGKGVILDSASRLWTLVKLGNIFDCASILRDRVTQWIMHGQNITFIEVLPEEALQIAFSLKMPQITESAFRILVNELALKLAADEEPHGDHSQTTIFGRRTGDLPDELSNLVQHAAQAFVARVSDINATMRNPSVFDFWEIEEWNTLRAIEQILAKEDTPLGREALAKIRILIKSLYSEVRSAWDQVTTTAPSYNHATYQSIDKDRLTYMDTKDFERAPIVMQEFNPVQMLLCAPTYNDVGVLLDGRRYRYSNSKLDGYKDRSYQSLVDDATNALRIFLGCYLSHAQNPVWASVPQTLPFPVSNMAGPVSKPIVSLDNLEMGIKKGLRPITFSWQRHGIEPPLNLTRHLLITLTDNELKFLPLWAGGCDDGTGGVFEDTLPAAVMGPNGPGPGFHTGLTIPSSPSSVSGSIIEDMDALRVWGSTTAASVNVHDSISTVYRSDQVIAEDKSFDSESFTVGGSEYADARYEIPADHQEMSEAINMTVETSDSESRSATEGHKSTSDESDDDMYMWNDDENDSDDSTDTIS
ncbi:hypothetical protein F66182_1052 [Fusarium sp. NRRL 66182]|nr:hypothetical protein F66182_1052 [Fusarium sp. NRRL 66182]